MNSQVVATVEQARLRQLFDVELTYGWGFLLGRCNCDPIKVFRRADEQGTARHRVRGQRPFRQGIGGQRGEGFARLEDRAGATLILQVNAPLGG